MTYFRTLSFLVLMSCISFSFAQNKSKETIKTDSENYKTIISKSSMYEGTKSKKAQASFEIASEYDIKKEFKDAEKYYLKAIKIDPKFIEAYDNLGLVYKQMGNTEMAKTYYKKSIKIYPDGELAHQNLAMIYMLEKDYKNAINSYKELLRISPINPEAYYGIANSKIMLREFKEAKTYADKAFEIYRETNSENIGDGYYLVGLVNYYNGEKENAKPFFDKARDAGVKIHPQIESELFGKDENVKNEIVLETEEDYKAQEQAFLKGYDWLVKTPIGQEEAKRQSTNAFLLKWMTGCPYMSVELSADVITYMKCNECLIIFMGGWTQAAIKSDGKISKYQGDLAGTEKVIEFYKLNKSRLGTIKEIEKFVKLQKEEKLEEYLSSK